MYTVAITNTDIISTFCFLIYNEHFLNNYEYHKVINDGIEMTLLVHLLQYRLHLSEITDTNTRNNGQ